MLCIVLIFCTAALFAQTATRDVVYLKSGGIIRGMIIETIPNVSIKIQTAEGNIFVCNFSDIDKFGKEPVPETESTFTYLPSETSTSPSFSIFGGAAFPMGDFASANSAYTGFAAGVQFVTGGQVGVLVSGIYASNPANTSSLMVYTPEKWQSIMALLGLKIGTANASGANFFIAPLAGVNFAKMQGLSNSSPFYYNSYAASSPSATAFAYGGMMEIDIKPIAIGARFITSKPKYDYSSTAVIGGYTYSESGTIEQSTMILIAYLGIVF